MKKIFKRIFVDRKTAMLRRYLLSFLFRLFLFVLVLLAYIYHKDTLITLATKPIRYGINLLHILWFYFMVMMLSHIFPGKGRSFAARKAKPDHYIPIDNYSKLEMYQFVQDQNRKAWMVMLVWLSGNGVIGILYLLGLLGASELILLSVFFFVCDYICIIFFCPFQSMIMKNRCCINCRIYDWGHFMMFTPLLFIPNFFSWSLFFTACVELIRWEILYTKYPERFWYGSNQHLDCANCNEQICKVKNQIHDVIDSGKQRALHTKD